MTEKLTPGTIVALPPGKPPAPSHGWVEVDSRGRRVRDLRADQVASARITSSETSGICRHCGGRITSDPDDGWVHDESGGVVCGLPANDGDDDSYRAEPLRVEMVRADSTRGGGSA